MKVAAPVGMFSGHLSAKLTSIKQEGNKYPKESHLLINVSA